MASGRPAYEPNEATRISGNSYEIEKLKRRLVPPPPDVADPRMVFGQIDAGSDDPLDAGSGDWSNSPGYSDDNGIWTIAIDPPFSSDGPPPTVVASENGSSFTPANFVVVDSVTVDTIVIKTYDGATRDLASRIGFNFLAVCRSSAGVEIS